MCFFVCVLCGLFLLVHAFCVVLLLVLCVSVLVFCERDKGIGLCIGPQPVDGCSPTAWPLRELID